MDKKIKDAYGKLNISVEAKERIQRNVMLEQKKSSGKRNMEKGYTWRGVAVACMLAVMVTSTGAYAATKVYQYFQSNINFDGKSVTMELQKKEEKESTVASSNIPKQYVKITTDFGEEYALQDKSLQDERNHDADIDGVRKKYSYKGNMSDGKSFWYELIYVDGDKNAIISTYNNEMYDVLTINERKAVFCKQNQVVGSVYNADNEYTQSLYIFFEEYGYIIRIVAQNNLEKQELVKLAEQIQIAEAASKAESSNYVLYSEMDKCGWEVQNEVSSKKLMKTKYYYTGEEAKVDGVTVKIVDVQILNSVNQLQKDAFHMAENYFDYDKIITEDGEIKSYKREKIKWGDGVSKAEREVVATQMVQPKLVYVTAEFTGKALARDGRYQVPALKLITKENGKVYEREDCYNRPEYISDAFTDDMPCYFEENAGGKSYWFAETGNRKITMHFAYLVDEDLVDGMALFLNDWETERGKQVYLDISQS